MSRVFCVMAAAVMCLACSTASAFDWDSSPYNWDNNQMNWENNTYNWENNPYNWDNSPHKYGNQRIIRDNQGNAMGYIVPKSSGGANLFDLDGNRQGYMSGD